MPKIELEIEINAPIELVFDLSRSIDLHQLSTHQTNEKAISGKTKGLLELNDSVTWRAKHFGIYQNLTSKITRYDRPNFFTDEMQKGAFKEFQHEHFFTKKEQSTIVRDVFKFKSPLGFLGLLANKLFLENYMRNFLIDRNLAIKKCAESNQWREILKG